MTVETLDFSETHCFDPIFLDYTQQKDTLKPFYHRFPTIENYKAQIEEKQKAYQHRDLLAEAWPKQYEGISLFPAEQKNLEALANPKTFTLTTGHQLNIFTGPLYFHLKIITVINAAKALKEAYPEYNFIPVYWMASEDHDLDEIRKTQIGDQVIEWKTDQSGPVGRMKPEGLAEIAKDLPQRDIFEKAYREHNTLAEAARYYVHALYGEEGLLVLDADDVQMKSTLKEVIQDDLFTHQPNTLAEAQSKALDKAGYKSQSFPREINFFYMEDGLRERITSSENGEHFEVLNRDLKFSKKEIQQLIEEHPERFSPNVILRPVYQEILLPNLSYSGGPAEVAYWLQLKPVFEHFQVPFPILLPRLFAMVINENQQRKINSLGIALKDLFEEESKLIKKVTEKETHHELKVTSQREDFKAKFASILTQALEVDPTLGPMAEAEEKRLMKSLDKIEKKMLRAEKKHHEIALQQVHSLKKELFPGGNLQERKLNFMGFGIDTKTLLSEILQAGHSLSIQFHLLII